MKKTIQSYNIGILGSMDATEIATKIKDKSISAQEAIACAIERAKQVNPTLNAVVNDCFESVSELKDIPTEGCFAGVPTFIKDLVHVKGLPTLHGTLSVTDKPQKKNEKIVDQILSTGAICLGKSSTSEFGLLPAVETLLHPPTVNPNNIAYSTGGSSGGAGALVVSGVVPFAHAADGGGSIRIPASCCGLIGLKPSRGRDIDSPTGVLPVDIVCQGVLTRSVRDTAHYFADIEKFHQDPKLKPIGLVRHPIKKRLRIAMFTETPSGINSHVDSVNAVLAAGKFCENLGHEVSFISSPFEQQIKIDFLAYWSFLTYALRRFGRFSYGIGFNKHKLETFTTQMAKTYSKVIFKTPGFVGRLKKFNQTYASTFDSYDVLLSPVLSHPVPKIGYFSPENNFFSTIEKLSQYVNFTTFQNITGAPAISLPMGVCANGLPLGLQFAGKVGDDAQLLELAYEIEAAGGLIDWGARLRGEK